MINDHLLTDSENHLLESHSSASSRIERLLTDPKDNSEKSLVLETEDSLCASDLLRMVCEKMFHCVCRNLFL